MSMRNYESCCCSEGHDVCRGDITRGDGRSVNPPCSLKCSSQAFGGAFPMTRFGRLQALSLFVASLVVIGGCATRPVNPPIEQADPAKGYRFETRQQQVKDKNNLVVLAF